MEDLQHSTENKKIPEARYRKTIETFTESYTEATEEADKLFAPYGSKTPDGSRTCAEAKVRIRRAKDDSGFRIVLSKAIKEDAKPTEKEEKKRKRRSRHRNDKKGRRRAKDRSS